MILIILSAVFTITGTALFIPSLRETKVNLNVILIMCRIVESELGDSYN